MPVDESALTPLAVLLEESSNVGRRKIEVVCIDIAENRSRAESSNDARGCEEGERSGHDLVAMTDAERHQRHQQCVGARGNADPEPCAAIGCDLSLESADLGPEDELLTFADLFDDALDIGAQRLILRSEIEKRYPHGRPD